MTFTQTGSASSATRPQPPLDDGAFDTVALTRANNQPLLDPRSGVAPPSRGCGIGGNFDPSHEMWLTTGR
jgi:hypothetical protein